MTDSQQSGFYFPVWAKCARALSWHSRPPAARQPSHGHGLANALYQQVWDVAQEIALRDFRAVKGDDLRHACNLVASADLKTKSDEQLAKEGRAIPGARGGRVSSRGFTTAETNHVVRLFRLLADPDNLKWHLEWNFPEDANRASILASLLEHADEAYAAWIARSRFGRRVEADPADYIEITAVCSCGIRRHIFNGHPDEGFRILDEFKAEHSGPRCKVNVKLLGTIPEKLLAEWQQLPMKDLRDLQHVVIQRWRSGKASHPFNQPTPAKPEPVGQSF